MSSVFRKGDVVFHNLHGKLTVTEPKHWNGDVYLSTEDNILITCDTRSLSFIPWPAPCHERPFTEVGWWMAASKYDAPYDGYDILWRFSEDKFGISENSIPCLNISR